MSLNSIHFSSALSPIDSPEPNQSKVQLKPDELQDAINAILTDGIKNHSSKDFMAEQIVELVNQNPDTAKELNLEPDFKSVLGNVVEPALQSNKQKAAEGKCQLNTQDGLSLSEANCWYRNGGGQALTVPLSSVDLSQVKASDFEGIGIPKKFNLLISSRDGPVYGTITLSLINPNTVVASNDIYNFDLKKLEHKSIKDDIKTYGRNIATVLGHIYAWKGDPFTIKLKGTTNIEP